MNSTLLHFGQSITIPQNFQSFKQYIYNKNLPLFQFLKFTNELMMGLIMGQTFINQCPIPCSLKCILPQQGSHKKTLVLDLDETLISTKVPQNQKTHFIKINVQGQLIEVGFALRPYLNEFLTLMSHHYELVLFTAATSEYAEKIAAVIDPKCIYFSAVMSREYCLKYNSGIYIKDLRIFSNRNLNNVLILDNSSVSFCLQPENGIPIVEWVGNENDQELIGVGSYLETVAKAECYPMEINAKRMQIKELLECYQQISQNSN